MLKHSIMSKSLVVASMAISFGTHATPLPGSGVKTTAVQSPIAEESFQTMIIDEALKRLGYDTQPIVKLEYREGYQAVAEGRVTYSTTSWDPLQQHMFEDAGGNETLFRKGQFIKGASQGYLIDKKTADQHNITNISSFKDPEIARLFDWDGDGKADMVGCQKGWGCADVTQYQLDAYGLRENINFIQGEYAKDILKTVEQFQAGNPVMYYTWTPYWLSGKLVPNKDVIWLEVPFSAHPNKLNTKLSNGKDYGFKINSMKIVTSIKFAKENPAAAKLFEIAQIPINDVSAQNKLIADGENSEKDIKRHVSDWIAKNQRRFDYWIEKALQASKKQNY